MNVEHNGKHHRFTYGLEGIFTSHEVATQVKEQREFQRTTYALVCRLAGAGHSADVEAVLGFSPDIAALWLCIGDIAPHRRAAVTRELGLIQAIVEGEEAARA